MDKKLLKLIFALCISMMLISNFCYAEDESIVETDPPAPGTLTGDIEVGTLSKGLYSEGGDTYYVLEQGILATNYMLNLHGKKYYFGDDSKMVKEELVEYENEKYFFDNNGNMLINGWVTYEETDPEDGQITRETYYFGPGGQAYRAKEGNLVIKNIEGSKFGFDDEGARLNGYVRYDGSEFEEQDNDIENIMYFFDPNDAGAAATGMVQYTGEFPDDYDDGEALFLFFDPKTCRKVCSNEEGKYLARVFEGERYLFDYRGVRQMKWFATPSNLDQPRYYNGSYDGFLSKGWFTAIPHAQSIESKNREYYNNNEEQWYYAGSDGKVVRSCIKKIGKYYFCFDRDGVMQEDCLVVVKNGQYMRSYNTDDVTYDQVVRGKEDGGLLDIDEKWLYFMYYENEDKEGSMCPFDKKIYIGLSDEEVTFMCSNRGGYGAASPSVPVLKGNKYYQNGVLLKPRNNIYGVVRIREDSGKEHFYVVNKNGLKMKSGCHVDKNKNFYLVGTDGEYRGTYNLSSCNLDKSGIFKYKEDTESDTETCEQDKMSKMEMFRIEDTMDYLNFATWEWVDKP